MVKVECQLCYQTILLIVKMTLLLDCFWCCRIVNESKYLAESHSFGLLWLWNFWHWHDFYGVPENYSCLQKIFYSVGPEASKSRWTLYSLCIDFVCSWAATWGSTDQPLNVAFYKTVSEHRGLKLPCWSGWFLANLLVTRFTSMVAYGGLLVIASCWTQRTSVDIWVMREWECSLYLLGLT